MNFVEAVRYATLGYRVRRPWKNNPAKHVRYTDGELVFIRCGLPMTFHAYGVDVLADDWERVPDSEYVG
jgi:hypothetical protein